jgi:site-specific DNA-methyltransferase (cytosine-N4-specific)
VIQVHLPLRDRLTVIEGDAQTVLKALPDRCIQAVVTSPPYWGTRDYKVAGQIGSEVTLEAYIQRLVMIFSEIKRLLKDNGVVWLNLGDVYASGNRRYRAPDAKYSQRALQNRPPTPKGLKPKDLLGIPWRVAFALQRRGWYLRTEVIWNKLNAMPESVRDRPSRSHEYIFLLTKSERYRFSRPQLENGHAGVRRTVWDIRTGRSKLDGHHAAFPESLVRPCISSSTHKNDLVLDPFCGTATVGRVCVELQRRFIGIELSPRYARAAAKTFGSKALVFTTRSKNVGAES